MEEYKQLNKQLVEQVQSMRNTLKEYRDEIVHLRGQLVETNIKSNSINKKCVDLATAHLRSFLELLDPKSSVLSLLEGGSPSVSSATIRQSSRLAKEMRRSSSVIQTRRSFNSVSPVRQTIEEDESEAENAEVVVVESEAQETLRDATLAIREELEEGDEAKHYVIKRNYENSPLYLQDNMSDVMDESTIDDSTSHIEREMSEEGESNSEPLWRKNSTEPKRTLRDVTNMLTQTDDSSHSTQNGKKNAFPSKSKENTKNVTLGRGNCRYTSKSNEITQSTTGDHQGTNSCSMEEVRNITHVHRHNEGSFRLSTQEESSFSLTDITMENFRVESSSTPRQTIRHQSSAIASTSKCDQSSRPQRSCKPTSLAERPLNAKLRNETSQKSLGIDKSRTKKIS